MPRCANGEPPNNPLQLTDPGIGFRTQTLSTVPAVDRGARLQLILLGVSQPVRQGGTIMAITVKWLLISLGVAVVGAFQGAAQEPEWKQYQNR